MQKYDPTAEQEQCFQNSVKELEYVNKQLSLLIARKEELTETIIGALDHEHDGQKTYEYAEWKLEVKTPCVYSLNKKLYESCAINLPQEFNPIKESKSYSIDKRLCEQYLLDAPEEVREQLIELIEKRPGKATISLKERV
jgi:hypothetical protein